MQVWLATSPEVEGFTGQYFARGRQRGLPPQVADASVRRRLWEQLTGLAPARRAAG